MTGETPSMKLIQKIHGKPAWRMRMGALFICCFSLLAWEGCAHMGKKASHGPEEALKKVSRFRYPRFSDDMPYIGLIHSIDMSLSYLRRVDPGKTFSFGQDKYAAPHMILSLETFKRFIEGHPGEKELNDFIKKNFFIYQSTANKGRGMLFTGYYEPSLQGSLVRSGLYRFPIYEPPPDMMMIDLSPFSTDLSK